MDESFNVPVSEFDGVVTYGEKRGTQSGMMRIGMEKMGGKKEKTVYIYARMLKWGA